MMQVRKVLLMFYICKNNLNISMMKKFILILSALLIAFACDPEDPSIDKGQLDPNAMILLRPAKGVQLRSTFVGLTALEIVQQATSIQFQTQYLDDVLQSEMKIVSRGFNEETMKDFNIPALKMLSIDVINAQGEYIRDFTTAKSVYITRVDHSNNSDTLAYIPDEIINAARPLIEAAFADENFTEVYRLFNEAFTFFPF